MPSRFTPNIRSSSTPTLRKNGPEVRGWATARNTAVIRIACTARSNGTSPSRVGNRGSAVRWRSSMEWPAATADMKAVSCGPDTAFMTKIAARVKPTRTAAQASTARGCSRVSRKPSRATSVAGNSLMVRIFHGIAAESEMDRCSGPASITDPQAGGKGDEANPVAAGRAVGSGRIPGQGEIGAGRRGLQHQSADD